MVSSASPSIQWTQPGLCIWTLPEVSQLLIHPSCIGNSLWCVGNRLPNYFSRIVPYYNDENLLHEREGKRVDLFGQCYWWEGLIVAFTWRTIAYQGVRKLIFPKKLVCFFFCNHLPEVRLCFIIDDLSEELNRNFVNTRSICQCHFFKKSFASNTYNLRKFQREITKQTCPQIWKYFTVSLSLIKVKIWKVKKLLLK